MASNICINTNDKDNDTGLKDSATVQLPAATAIPSTSDLTNHSTIIEREATTPATVEKPFAGLKCRKNDFVVWLSITPYQEQLYSAFLLSDQVQNVCMLLWDNYFCC
jgi:hypothetical protein